MWRARLGSRLQTLVRASPQQLRASQALTVRWASVATPTPANLTIDPASSFAGLSQPRNDLPRIPINNGDKEDSASEVEESASKDDTLSDVAEEAMLLETRITHPPAKKYAIPLPRRLHVEVHTLFRPDYDSQVGTIHLDAAVWGRDPIRVDLLKRAVDYYRHHARGQRKAVTKTISEVSGSGKKMRQQKGTGMARAGHKRPPHWRGGAKAHGPKNVTNYAHYKLNKKVRQQALSHALSQKLLEGNVILLDQLYDLPTHKTRDLQRLLQPWGICTGSGGDSYSALLLDHYYPDEQEKAPEAHRGTPANLWVASQNLTQFAVGNTHRANVYEILKHDKLVLTLDAMHELERRLGAGASPSSAETEEE